MLKILKTGQINVKMELYPREYFNNMTAESYAQAMRMGEKFPPIEVAVIEGQHYLVDGMHRLKAFEKNGEEHVQVNVNDKIRDFKDLFVEAVKFNMRHGMALTRYDKELIVERLQEFKMKNDEISRLVLTPISKLRRVDFSNFKSPTGVGTKGGKDRGDQIREVPAWVGPKMYENHLKEYRNQVVKRYVVMRKGESRSLANCVLIQSFHDLQKVSRILHPDFEISEVRFDLDGTGG